MLWPDLQVYCFDHLVEYTRGPPFRFHKGVLVLDREYRKDLIVLRRNEMRGLVESCSLDAVDLVKDHTKDVSDFKRESMSAQDPDFNTFAAQTLPTLQEHLKQATSIAPSTTAQNSAR